MYQTGELVVYGSSGVCRVDALTRPVSRGADRGKLFYLLKPLYQDGVIYSPVESGKVPIRPVIPAVDARALLEEIPSLNPQVFRGQTLQALTQHYQAVIRSHDCRELLGQVIQLCSGFYLKSQNKYILAAKKLVQEQYSDPTLSLASVAEALGIHPNYLSKLFKTSINLNFIDYSRSYRVQRSRELLERELSVNAVAEQTGFSSPQSFIRVFKASVGCTPGQYRKQNK